MLGSAMGSLAMPLVAVKVLHASTLAVASLTAATYLPYLLIGLPAGAWVDRLPSRAVLVSSDIASFALYASLPLAAALGVLTIGQLVAVALLAGASRLFFSSAYNIYLRNLVAEDDLVEGNAKLSGSGAVTQIGGPGLAGLCAQAIGAVGTLLFDAGSFLFSAVCLLRIDNSGDHEPRPARESTIREEIREGIAFVSHDIYLRPLVVWAALTNIGLAGYFALIVVFLVRSVGLSPGVAGALLTIGGVGGLVGALLARRITDRLGTSRTFVLNCAITGPCGLLIAFTGHGARLAFCLVGVLMLEGGLVLGTVILATFRQAYCPPGMLGRVSTAMQMVTYGTAPFGALAAGLLGNVLGPREALLIMMSVDAGAVIFLLISPFAARRDMPVYSPPAPAAES